MPVDQTDATEMTAVLKFRLSFRAEPAAAESYGLTAPSYQLRIDDTSAGVFTRAQLQSGIDLASPGDSDGCPGSQGSCAYVDHNQLHFNGWRGVQIPLAFYQFSNYQPAMNALNDLEQQIVASQRAAAQPQPHSFELRPN